MCMKTNEKMRFIAITVWAASAWFCSRHIGFSVCLQESGSIYLQFTCSTMLQLEVIFEVLEEFDWTAFSVVTTRHHGYEDFLAMVEGMTDGSFIGWERKSVVVLNVTDDPGGTRTKRLLKDNEAQVRSWRHKRYFWLAFSCYTSKTRVEYDQSYVPATSAVRLDEFEMFSFVSRSSNNISGNKHMEKRDNCLQYQ